MLERNRPGSFPRAVRAACLLVSVLLGADPAAGAPGHSVVSVLGVRDPRLVPAVSAAVARAAEKLAEPGCREIFEEFRDADGRPLAANLEAAGQTPESYLHWLIFRNGSAESCCSGSGVAAATNPGSRFVLICGRQFLAASAARDGYAADLVIHEELHAIGLGENPPSSAEITARVVARCGR